MKTIQENKQILFQGCKIKKYDFLTVLFGSDIVFT